MAEKVKVSGDKIRHHRLRIREATGGRKGSQTWLAEQVGAHVTSISDWERGVNQPSVRHLGNLARALGVPVQELLADPEDDEDSPMAREQDELLAALAPLARLLEQAGVKS